MGCDYTLQPIVELTYNDGTPSLQFIDFQGAVPMYMMCSIDKDFYGEIDRRINEWKTTCPTVTIYDNGIWNKCKNVGYVYRSTQSDDEDKYDDDSKYVYVSPENQGISIGYTKKRILELINFVEIDKIATIKILPGAERRH